MAVAAVKPERNLTDIEILWTEINLAKIETVSALQQ